jgi:hypothetical protein
VIENIAPLVKFFSIGSALVSTSGLLLSKINPTRFSLRRWKRWHRLGRCDSSLVLVFGVGHLPVAMIVVPQAYCGSNPVVIFAHFHFGVIAGTSVEMGVRHDRIHTPPSFAGAYS